LSNATPNSGGTITITPVAINAGASVAVAPSGAVNISAAAGTVSAAVPSTGNILRTTLTGTGTGTLPGQDVLGPPPGH
jgi:proline racemase